jgi:hypothetical protein
MMVQTGRELQGPDYPQRVRHNASTVVVLAGQPGEGLLAAISRFMNVSLVRPDADDSTGGIEAAAGALRRAAGISSPYVMVAADPLAAVAAEWQSMWTISPQPRGSDGFELRAGEALASWRARQFELPDYYLVLADQQATAQQAAARQATARQAEAQQATARPRLLPGFPGQPSRRPASSPPRLRQIDSHCDVHRQRRGRRAS